MHVLVIGGNRFVGRLLAWRLLARGDRVALLNRGTLDDPFGERVERLRGDRTTADLDRLLAGRTFDACVDLAAFTGDDGRRAAEVLRGKVGHHVMVSTGQVYLVRDGCPRPAREADYDGPVIPRPADPRDHRDWDYGIGKRACEDALRLAFERDRFPTTRIRIPVVNGERDYLRRLESYLWRLLDGGPVILPDGGPQRLRHVYGAEVARFLADVLGRADTFGEAYNVAQEEAPTLAELVALVRAELGSTGPVLALPSSAIRAAGLDPAAISPYSDRWISFVDPSRARDALGFRHLPLPEYLGRIVASFLAHPPADRPAGYAHRDAERRLAG